MPINRYSRRFEELLEQVQPIEASKRTEHSQFSGSYDNVDVDALLGWRVKVRNLIKNACGEQSEHYRQFIETEKPVTYRSSWRELQQLKAVMLAAQEDYDGGHLDKVRSLVQAEVFVDELDQARELLNAGYPSPAAVVAGVVLETKLRDMCSASGLPHGNLNKMNADLAKAGAYNLLIQKTITALADVRNSAAHGKPEQFGAEDVSDMIDRVERFLADNP